MNQIELLEIKPLPYPPSTLWYVDFIYKDDRIIQLEDMLRKINKIKDGNKDN